MSFINEIKTYAKSEYAKLIEASCHDFGFPGPPQIVRYWNSLIGYFTSRLMLEFIGDRQDILLTGDGGGRDYWYLRWHQKKPLVIDIAEQENIPDEDLIIHDLAKPLPFEKERFDAVVAMDVLEHLIDDAFALREFNRVLKPDGVLIASVPFLHDIVEPHVRIHTLPTFKRLLNATGFTVTDCVMRGGLLAIEGFKIYFALKTVTNYLAFRLLGRTCYHWINNGLFRLQLNISRNDSFLIRFARPPLYGCFVRCKKGNVTDFSRLSREWFKDMGVKFSNTPG